MATATQRRRKMRQRQHNQKVTRRSSHDPGFRYRSMTVPALRAEARARGIRGYSKMIKGELIINLSRG